MTATLVKESRHIMADIENNNNKFWNILLYEDNTVITQWGRVGEPGQSKSFPHSDRHRAEKFYDSKCREKTKKGYNESKVLAGSTAKVQTVQHHNLAEVAKKQISTNSPLVLKLVEYLSQVNVHQILAATTMSYDTSKGTFSTPLGVVTKDALTEARNLLTEIGNYVQKSDYDNPSFTRAANLYLMRVPRNIGRGRPDLKNLYPNLSSIQEQNSILDALDASLQLIVSTPKDGKQVEEQKVFEAKLNYVEDGNTIDAIRRKYKSTMQSSHACFHLDVDTVYELEISSMKRAFEVGSKVGNIMQLWHGSAAGNILSILKSGYVIPPSNAAHVTARMFGNGVYFSDQSTKSLNYAYGYWSGRSKDNHCFMLLNDVAMGKFYVPPGSSSNLPKPGYNSTFAQAGKSGVQNNEMIVYSTDRINPKFLIKFAPKR